MKNKMVNEKFDHVIGGGMGYGSGFGGGSLIAFLVIILVLWLLFDRRDDHGRGGYGYEGHGCECHGTRPAFYDESNFEEERNLDRKLCGLDHEILEESQKTRALIEANYIQDLRDKLEDARFANMELKQTAFITAQIGGVDAKIERLSCELPKRPPVFSTCSVPCNKEIVTGCGGCERPFERPFDGLAF